MRIEYYKNGETTIARGTSNPDQIGPEGIPNPIVIGALLDNTLRSREHATLMAHHNHVSKSTPRGGDEYDERIGRAIARDKTIIKSCSLETKQLDIIEKYLENQLELVRFKRNVCASKAMKADERLSRR